MPETIGSSVIRGTPPRPPTKSSPTVVTTGKPITFAEFQSRILFLIGAWSNYKPSSLRFAPVSNSFYTTYDKDSGTYHISASDYMGTPYRDIPEGFDKYLLYKFSLWHESQHIAHTDFEQATTHDKLTDDLSNIIEDVRIETKAMKQWKGVTPYRDLTYAYAWGFRPRVDAVADADDRIIQAFTQKMFFDKTKGTLTDAEEQKKVDDAYQLAKNALELSFSQSDEEATKTIVNAARGVKKILGIAESPAGLKKDIIDMLSDDSGKTPEDVKEEIKKYLKDQNKTKPPRKKPEKNSKQPEKKEQEENEEQPEGEPSGEEQEGEEGEQSKESAPEAPEPSEDEGSPEKEGAQEESPEEGEKSEGADEEENESSGEEGEPSGGENDREGESEEGGTEGEEEKKEEETPTNKKGEDEEKFEEDQDEGESAGGEGSGSGGSSEEEKQEKDVADSLKENIEDARKEYEASKKMIEDEEKKSEEESYKHPAYYKITRPETFTTVPAVRNPVLEAQVKQSLKSWRAGYQTKYEESGQAIDLRRLLAKEKRVFRREKRFKPKAEKVAIIYDTSSSTRDLSDDYRKSVFAVADAVAYLKGKLALYSFGSKTVKIKDQKDPWLPSYVADVIAANPHIGGTMIGSDEMMEEIIDYKPDMLFVFTDGVFGDQDEADDVFARYKEAGISSYGIAIDDGDGTAKALAEVMKRYAFKKTYGISNVNELPKVVLDIVKGVKQ